MPLRSGINQQPTAQDRSKRKSDDEKTPRARVAQIIEQRKASMRFYNENYYTEMAEIYRNLNARTKPTTYYDEKTGQREEREDDGSRTNVCVPDHFVMWRRGTSRLTRNPPNLRVRGGPDSDQGQAMADKVAAKLMFNWDRAESQKAFKKIVSGAYAFGYGVGKSYYDEVPVVRRLRRLTETLAPKDFQNLANAKNPQIAAAVRQLGPRLQDPTPFTPEEQAGLLGMFGDEVSLKVSTVKFKGPVLNHVFFGDFFPEPGFKSLPQSGYCIENSQQDQEFLDYWMNQTTIDPRTGEESPVFDAKACDSVMKKAGQRTYIDEQELSLRRRMREEIEMADPITAGKPIKAPKKRFMCDERHTFIDGHLAIDFVGEESDYLGRLWYPWDTYGRYTYSEMILIPDLLGGIGMSTLRVTRFLMMLRNTRMNQTTDFLNNILLPLMLQRRGTDQTSYDLVRTAFCRLVQVDNMSDLQVQQDPRFPNEAWQDQAQIQQQMQSADPTISDFAPGTADNPQAGKFATTAALQAKSSDAVTADTLDQINMFVRDVVEIQLWMDQQAMDEPVDVPKSYFERIDAISLRGEGGQAKVIKVSPIPDMQEDYEILPEAGSTLAADDTLKITGLQQFWALGQAHPDIVNLRAVATQLARATPGINPETVILPEPPPQPPMPPFKASLTISVKWSELPPDVQAALLSKEGLPTDITHLEGMAKLLGKASEAADHAANLESPVDHNPELSNTVPAKKPNGAPPSGKK